MEYQNFKLIVENHVARVAFNRPHKSNALDQKSWDEMKEIFEKLDKETDVRVIVLLGEGKNFCAGIDISMLSAVGNTNKNQCQARFREQVRESILFLQECITAIERCRKPVLAAIQKGCIGGGVDIVSACDMRFCTQDAYFSIKEIDMGLVADVGTLQRLPKILNPGIVAELAYTGRKVSGAEAHTIGLVNRTFDDYDSMIQHVMDLAQEIASKSPLVIRGIKENLLYSRDHSVDESLQYVATYNAAYLYSDDIIKALQAHVTKVPPVFDS